ncbi:phosphopantothenate--cysteine ligase isoform X2 [Corythoichthys intestinalis]|uniref:phosphopantothenate--cysteine ligase isoform X2 n=1 Tax=Corythoichthys intestinalis TaxID=161448 RepID=UPI0025A63E72|nr:phosphopantothenate--cysteine ligase isoform X2 [Corythoichthys intestinalis]
MAEPRVPSIDGKLAEEFAAPSHIDEVRDKMAAFARLHAEAGRRVVLITSGGTKVPLESRTVRFLDNFSSGRRGAQSAECFLDAGYAVVFLHRHRSLYPYARMFSSVNMLDALQFSGGDQEPDRVVVNPQVLPDVAKVLKKYQEVTASKLLLPVEFSTLSEYLHLLKASAQALNAIGFKAMFYLAAAVSDFYIPASDMPEHKIQSSNGPLQFEDGSQNLVSTGEGLGAAGLRHILQTGDRHRHPSGQSSESFGHVQAPGSGGQRAGFEAGPRSGGDTYQPA